MVISTKREIKVSTLEHSRSERDSAVSRVREEAVRAVLEAARDDVDVRHEEDAQVITVSASLVTLNRQEFTALAELLRAHDKGYAPATLAPLLGALAVVFRR